MVAIGDAEGTVSIMQLCKALYETAPREKEEMVKIFEREFRREKTLDIAKKMAFEAVNKKTKLPKGEKPVDPEEVARQKEVELKTRLTDIDEKFFERIAKDDADQEIIKARGQTQLDIQQESAPVEKELPSQAKSDSKYVIVNFAEGDYTVTNSKTNAVFTFKVEAGSVLTSDQVNGSVQDGKLIANIDGADFEGNFIDENSAECSCVGPNGEQQDPVVLKFQKL